MYTNTYRSRSQSVSDTHIVQCGCTHCDGSGFILHESRHYQQSQSECPLCEGLGFLADNIELPLSIHVQSMATARILPITTEYSNPANPLKNAA
ncbi:MAG: zinc finger-like domain-containing protein [Rhodothermaceae bacterium]|nr:zinc finger-like domain-containing protein [Rhodothermaceae bacterium]